LNDEKIFKRQIKAIIEAMPLEDLMGVFRCNKTEPWSEESDHVFKTGMHRGLKDEVAIITQLRERDQNYYSVEIDID
jgi:hypothetical protein